MAKQNRRVNSRSYREPLRYTQEEGNAVRAYADAERGAASAYSRNAARRTVNAQSQAATRRAANARSAGSVQTLRQEQRATDARTSRQAQYARRSASAVRARQGAVVRNPRESEAYTSAEEIRRQKVRKRLVEKKQKREWQRQQRRNEAIEAGRAEEQRAKAFLRSEKPLSPAYVVFLGLICTVTVILCVHFLQLKSTRTAQLSEIAAQQSVLTKLRADNDAYDKKVTASEPLEEIKQYALNKLGMHYATESQIKYYNTDENSYVRQYADVPEE